MGYPEDQDIRTGKAPKHQAAAEKAANNISNAEIIPKSDNCTEKVMKKLDDWNPNKESVEKLADLLNELDNCDDYNVDDPYALESRLSVADEYKEFADDHAHIPLWTVNYEGYALVGENAGTIKHVDEIDKEYFTLHTPTCAIKIMKKLDDWNPNEETIEELIDLLDELEECDDYNVDDPYDLESRLSVADGYEEFAVDYAHLPLWTVDYEGNALVDEEEGRSITPVDDIDEEYFTLHGFSREEKVAIENTVDAKMMEDEPVDDTRGKIHRFEDGSKWGIFENSDLAESTAVEYVRGMLKNEPESFNREWLQKYIAVGNTDKRMLALDESKSYAYDQIDDDSAMRESGLDDKFNELQEDVETLESEVEDLEEEKANLESEKENEEHEDTEDKDKIDELSNEIDDLESEISNKMDEIHTKGEEQEVLPDEAREKVEENKYTEVYDELEDPVQHFVEDHGLYSIEDLMKASFITINIEDAAYDAIDEDGAAHFLASYDGNEVEVGNGMVMFRTE